MLHFIAITLPFYDYELKSNVFEIYIFIISVSAPHCKEKWKNLSTVFVRKLKPAQSGSSAKSKKPYYLNEIMQFLLPFVKPSAPNTDSQGSLPSPPPDTDKSGSEDDADCDKVDTLPKMQASVQETEPAPKKSQGKKKKYELSKVDQSFIEFCEQQKRNKYDNDPRNMFLMSLLPEIHEMSDSQMKQFKRRVLLLIDDILGDMPTQHETSTSSVSSH
jgi:hypothetical protein